MRNKAIENLDNIIIDLMVTFNLNPKVPLSYYVWDALIMNFPKPKREREEDRKYNNQEETIKYS